MARFPLGLSKHRCQSIVSASIAVSAASAAASTTQSAVASHASSAYMNHP